MFRRHRFSNSMIQNGSLLRNWHNTISEAFEEER